MVVLYSVAFNVDVDLETHVAALGELHAVQNVWEALGVLAAAVLGEGDNAVLADHLRNRVFRGQPLPGRVLLTRVQPSRLVKRLLNHRQIH